MYGGLKIMSNPGPEDEKSVGTDRAATGGAGAAAQDPEILKTKFNPRHLKLFMSSEGEIRADGLEINQDPLPAMGTDRSRNLL
jgi:hypothetical protein